MPRRAGAVLDRAVYAPREKPQFTEVQGTRLMRSSALHRGARRQRIVARVFEWLEDRRLLTGTDLTIPLDPTLDQFGDQIVTIQAYGDASRAAFGIFDTGASAVTFSADDQAVFVETGGGVPIKNAGGAAATGIGGDIVGDVSEPGVILADGMNAAELSFDSDGFPVFQ